MPQSYNVSNAPIHSKATLGTSERTFAQLPAVAKFGEMCNVSDSNTATWGATVAGGGTNHILARFNGTVWTVVGK